jgi:hypothetical protein
MCDETGVGWPTACKSTHGHRNLTTEVAKWESKAKLEVMPHRITIWRWESGEASPSPEYRMLLGRMAMKHGHQDLAEVFRAPISVWRVVAHVKLRDNHSTAETQQPVR